MRNDLGLVNARSEFLLYPDTGKLAETRGVVHALICLSVVTASTPLDRQGTTVIKDRKQFRQSLSQVPGRLEISSSAGSQPAGENRALVVVRDVNDDHMAKGGSW